MQLNVAHTQHQKLPVVLLLLPYKLDKKKLTKNNNETIIAVEKGLI